VTKRILAMAACVVLCAAVCLPAGEDDYPRWLVFKIAEFDRVTHSEDGLSSVIEGRTEADGKFKFKAEWRKGSKAASYVDRWIADPKPEHGPYILAGSVVSDSPLTVKIDTATPLGKRFNAPAENVFGTHSARSAGPTIVELVAIAFDEPIGPAQGEHLLRRMAEVNRYWLAAPHAGVERYSYDFVLAGDAKKQQVRDVSRTSRAQRQGISYSTCLHALAADPVSWQYDDFEEDDETIRLTFYRKEPARIACGNGIARSWRGYFSRSAVLGVLWLDARHMVPLRLETKDMVEEFGDYVALDDGQFAPLSVRVTTGAMDFRWSFRVYEPGLWLFHESMGKGHDGSPSSVASTRNVVLNDRAAVRARAEPLDVAAVKDACSMPEEKLEKMTTVIDAVTDRAPPRLSSELACYYRYGEDPGDVLRITISDWPLEEHRDLRVRSEFAKSISVESEIEREKGEVAVRFLFAGEKNKLWRVEVELTLLGGDGEELYRGMEICMDGRITAEEAENASLGRYKLKFSPTNSVGFEMPADALRSAAAARLVFRNVVIDM